MSDSRTHAICRLILCRCTDFDARRKEAEALTADAEDGRELEQVEKRALAANRELGIKDVRLKTELNKFS